MSQRSARDESIDEAFNHLVDDDLEGFALAARVDGELKAVSFTPQDEGMYVPPDAPLCRLPRNELLGKLIADFALIFAHPPEEIANVATHVSTDHLGITEEKVEQAWAEFIEEMDVETVEEFSEELGHHELLPQ
jgi:hypothetical protein